MFIFMVNFMYLFFFLVIVGLIIVVVIGGYVVWGWVWFLKVFGILVKIGCIINCFIISKLIDLFKIGIRSRWVFG